MWNAELVPRERNFTASFRTNRRFEVGGFGKRVVTVEKDYEQLNNKPRIEGIELIGDMSFEDLSLAVITANDIDDMIFG